MTAPVYRVVGWNDQFENNRTRDLKHLDWLRYPIHLHRDAYAEIASLKDGAAILGAWQSLAQVAATCRPRGTLLRDCCEPHTAHTLSVATRLPMAVVELALEVLCRRSIGWMEVGSLQGDAFIPQEPRTNPAPSCGIPAARVDVDEKKTKKRENVAGADASHARSKEPSKEALEVAHYLRDAILSHTPDHACRLNGRADKWARDIDLAIREDKRTVEGLKRAIDFAHKRDGETFWRPNIQSGKKLRAQYDTMLAQAKRDHPPKGPGLLERLGLSTEGFTG